MANIEAENADLKESLGVNHAQAEEISDQLTQQISFAFCDEGSDERNAFDESVKACCGQ